MIIEKRSRLIGIGFGLLIASLIILLWSEKESPMAVAVFEANVHDDRSGSNSFSLNLGSLHTNYPPKVDGNLSDWPDTDQLVVDSVKANFIVGGEPSTADLSADFRSMWTNNMLYFAVWVHDNELVTDSEDPWEDDNVEIGIDGLNDGLWGGTDDHQYTVSVDDRQTDGGTSTTDFVAEVQHQIDGWTVEIAIPSTDLGIGSLAAGKLLGFNLGIADDDDGQEMDAFLVWLGDRTWQVQPEWGELQLLDQPSAVTPTPGGNPTATPTPPGRTTTYQFGLNGYSDTVDTVISGWPEYQNSNFGETESVGIRSNNVESALLKFELHGIPRAAQVSRATLSLRSIEQSNTQPTAVDVFALRRHWEEIEATWKTAHTGIFWSVPGADGTSDRDMVAIDRQTLDGINQWYSFDITQLVQEWLENPEANHGLVLKGASPSRSVYYGFLSSEPANVLLRSYRPELIVSFWESGITKTNTPTPTSTPSPTPTGTPTLTGSPSAVLDAYEPDNNCQDSTGIEVNGLAQTHNFHNEGDVDWLRLQAVAGTRYVISAQHLGDRVDPEIALFDVCDSPNPITETKDFGPDTNIVWQAANSGHFYLRLNNTPESVFGHNTEYQVSIRTLTTGAAIIASGRLYSNEELQPQINYMSERAYRVFNDAGYDHDDIYFLSADQSVSPYIDAPSNAITLQFAITSWAGGKLEDGAPLYIYLVDHGEQDQFYLDTGSNIVTAEQLDRWLLTFQNQHPASPIIIIIEACFSGSFVTPLHSISREGRTVITATGDNNWSYAKRAGEGGAEFSDPFFDALARNSDLWTSYQLAAQAVRGSSARDNQTPWLDGDGDGLPYPLDVDDEGAGRHLGLGRVSGGFASSPPYLEPPFIPQPNEGAPTHIAIKALDESLATLRVWMEVTTPTTPPPSAPPGYITPISHAQRVNLTYNNTISDRFEVDFTFDERGHYQFIFQAEDAGGQRAQPVVVELQHGGVVYLPNLLNRRRSP